MRIVVIGITGMLGQALSKEATSKKIDLIGAARRNAEIKVDIADQKALKWVLEQTKPDVIINTAAITNLSQCDENPLLSYAVNTESVRVMAEYCCKRNKYFIQISTDHYYVGDGQKKHDEKEAIVLCNIYARSKYLGERIALSSKSSLVIRTNIVGFRGRKEQPTIVEWAIEQLKARRVMTLFDDFYTSSIHTRQLASVLFDLLPQRVTGILNVASSEVSSKKDFIIALAKIFGFNDFPFKTASVRSLLGAKRADSLGLDVSKAEWLLGYRLPGLAEVVQSIQTEYKEDGHEI